MEKRFFSTSFAQHGFIGWLFVLSLFLSSFAAYGQAPAPTGLSVASLTQTTAAVSWECEPSSSREDGDLLRYDYVVSTNQLSTTLTNSEFSAMTEGSNGVLLVGRAVEMATNQLPIDGLSTGTMYYMLIRQNAEDIFDGTSSWVALSFNTLCEGTELPIALQTFDGASMPACWVGAGENIPVLQSAYKFGDSGNALKLESTAENYSYLFSPVILGSSSASELVFKMYTTGPAHQRFSVGVADANDIMNYVPVIQDSIAPGEWHDISVVDANGFFENNYVWVIYAEAGTPSVFYIDNVEVHDKPACVRPQGLNVTNVTATGATFAWTPQGSETAWNLELTAEGAEPIVVPATENPFVYEGLNEVTTYSVRVQADCGAVDGVSEWSTSIVFKTPQMPLPLPYECDFESGASWNLINGSSVNAWVIGSAVHNGGSKALYISKDGGTSNTYNNETVTNVWATRLLEVTEEGNYLFSFDWKGKGESSFDYLAAVLMPASVILEAGSNAGLSFGSSDVTIPDGWISLSGTTRLNMSDTWQTCVSEQHLLPGQYNLAFFWKNDHSDGSDPAAAVDNVSITKVLCPKPEMPTLSNLTANTVTLVFEDNRDYNVKVFAAQSDDPATDEGAVFAQENVATNCQVSGLTENTMYYVYLQAVCTEGDSEWAGPVQLTTSCASIAAADLPYVNGFEEEDGDFPECWTLVYSDYNDYPYIQECSSSNPAYEGTYALYSSYYTGGWDDDPESFNGMMALPGLSEEVDLTTLSLRFYMKGSGADIAIGVMSDPTNEETFTEVERVRGSGSYNEYFVHFTSYEGDGRYIALKYDSVFATVYIDQMSIMPTPTCFKPVSFAIKDVMTTEATVEVSDVDHTNIVDIEYGLTGFVQGSGTIVQIPAGDSVVTLTGLVAQTAYDVYVRNHCADDDVSEWLPKQSFTTMCVPDNVTADSPFVEDFESYGAGAVDNMLGGCWMQPATSSKTWKVSDGESGSSYSLSPIGTYSAALAWGANAWMYRSVHLEPGNYQLSCDAVQDAANGCSLSLGFGETFSTITKIQTQQIINGDYQLVRGEFTVASEDDYVIGIHGELTSSPYYVMVDNIRLTMVNCLTPSTPTVSNITDVSAKVSWGTTNAASYNLKLFTSRPADVNSGTPVYEKTSIVSVNGHLYDSITGLSSQTTYYAYVQSVCDDGSVSEWSNYVEFTTECSPIVLSEETPYIDGFEDDSQLGCWNLTIQEEGDAGTSTSTKLSGTTAIYAYKTSAVSPQFSFADGDNMSNYQLSGFAYASTDTLSFTISVMKNSDREGLQVYKDVTIYKKQEWTEFTVIFDLMSALPDVADYKYLEINFTEEDRIYIDDLRFEVIPTCPKPTDISFSEIGETSAQMDWVPNGSETQWRVVVKEAGATEELINELVSEHPYSLTGLTSNTVYEVSLRAVCVEGTDESLDVNATFKTSCGVMSLPFSENFNSLTAGIPDCWDNSEGTTTTESYKWNYSSSGYEGACLLFNSYSNTEGNTNYLKTPAINLTSDARLKFMYRKQSSTGTLAVYLSVDGAPYTDVVLATDLYSSSWSEAVFDLSAYTGSEVVIVFEGISDWGSYNIFVDNVAVEEIPSCEKPQDLSVATSTTEATITVIDEAHTAWEYIYGATGFDITEATPVAMSSNTATINDLTAETDYEVYVRAVCAEEDKSAWYGPVSFRTACASRVIPFSEYFNGLTSGIPDCWNNEEGTTTNDAHRWSYDSSGYEGGCLKFNSYSNAAGNTNYLKTPAINLTSDAHLKFMYRKQSSTGTLAVYLSVDGAPYTDVVLAADLYSSSWSEAAYDLSAYTGSEVVIVFEGISDYGSYNIFVDNVVVEEIPSCERPLSVKTSNVTATSVDVVITDPYGSVWEVVTGVKGFNPNEESLTVTPLSSLAGTISGTFEPNVEMDLYVRTDCGEENGKSLWYGPVTFMFVDWSAVAGEGVGIILDGDYPWEMINDAGTKKAQSTNVGVNNSSSDLTATFTLEEGERATLSFEYYASSEEGYYSLSDYLMMFVDPEENFTNSDYNYSFGKKGGPAGQSGSYSINFNEPGIHTVIWRYYKGYSGAAGDDLARIWNVTLVKSNFYAPENLAISEVTENSAVLSWTSSLGATGHQLRLVKVGVDTVYVNGLTDTIASLTSLSPNTEYMVTVRSTKGAAVGDTTAWSSPLTFRTPMVPVSSADLPYSQNWEGTTENGNWALLGNSSSVNKWMISDKDENAVMENIGSALYVSYNDSANMYSTNVATSIYAYRSFNLDAGAYSLSFDWKANGELGEYIYDYLRVFLVPSNIMLKAGEYSGSSTSVPEGWMALTEALAGTTEWTHEDRTVILEEEGYYNLVFLWKNDGSEGNQTPAAVDNVVFDVVNCVAVSNMKVSDRGVDYIEVVWDSPLSDNFQAVCVAAGTDTSTVDEGSYVSISKDTVRFEGLTENDMYDIYVRSVCDEDDMYSAWSSLTDVMAYKEYASLPYSCDFETVEAYAWTLANGSQTNQWHVGSAVNNGGSNALYISHDDGLSHDYNKNSTSSVYAVRKFRTVEQGLYIISFDWMCAGDVYIDYVYWEEYYYDYLQAYLAPGDAAITAGTTPSTTWTALTDLCVDEESWVSFTKELELEAGDYQLVFYWVNDNTDGTNPPAAIDNVSISQITCMYPTAVGADAITDNSARLFWSGDAGIGYEVRVDESDAVATMSEPFFVSDILTDTTVNVNGLLSNTEYHMAVRSICAEGDTSRWTTYSITTTCAPTELPYHDSFDNDPSDNCWSKYLGIFTEQVSTSDLSSSSYWSYSSASYGDMDGHMCLNIYGSTRRDWLVTPSIMVEEIEGSLLRFDLSLNPYSSTGTYQPGAQADDKFIVAISTDNGRTWNRSNGRIWDNAGSEYVYDNISSEGETVMMSLSDFAESGDTIRVAFYGESTVTGGDNNLRIDNVDISMVETVELSDSICARTTYSDNGFSIQADELTPGMHHQFNRFEAAVAEGATDKMYVLNLYVYPDGNVVVYDTVCAGTPYNEYGFSIENPVTRTYYSPSGLYTANGCDSTVTLHLFVPETQFNERVTICEGDSYEFAGQELTESGTYTHTFAGMYCDSTVTLELVVLPSVTEESKTICYGDSVLFDNVWRKTSGDYTAVFENSIGCDSTVTLHLTVREEIRYDYSGVLCVGGVYSDENFADLTEAGDHVVTLTSVTGCDSIVTLHLTEKTIAPTSFDEEICEGESYSFGDGSYNTTGEYPYTFESVDGCDSVVTLRLTVLPVSESEMTLELTSEELPYELKHNGETVYVVEESTEPGTYWPEITIENGAANGCDSIINLTLTVKLGDALHLTDYEELQFWPNPIDRGGKVLISADFSPAERTNLKIEVYNSIGQCVATHRPTGESLYVEDFHVSGMYLVKVTTGTGKLYVGHVIVK